MSDNPATERWMEQLASRVEPAPVTAPSDWKARLYSRLVSEQAVSPGLATLTQSSRHGYGLCIFEKLVQIAPVGERVEQMNPCRVCHARVLSEHMKRAPVYWPNCPYSQFQSH